VTIWHLFTDRRQRCFCNQSFKRICRCSRNV